MGDFLSGREWGWASTLNRFRRLPCVAAPHVAVTRSGLRAYFKYPQDTVSDNHAAAC